MAWLDMRTTSGSWRVARDFPNLPTWIVKAVGGTTTHWAGATPRFMEHEFRIRSVYGDLDGANMLDWPITLEELAPWYDKAEIAMGSTHRHGRAPLPANNNYTVMANGDRCTNPGGNTAGSDGPAFTLAKESLTGRQGEMITSCNSLKALTASRLLSSSTGCVGAA